MMTSNVFDLKRKRKAFDFMSFFRVFSCTCRYTAAAPFFLALTVALLPIAILVPELFKEQETKHPPK